MKREGVKSEGVKGEGLGYADSALGFRMAAEVRKEIEAVRAGGTHPTYQAVLDALALIPEGEAAALLDVGCGIGLYCEVIRQSEFASIVYEGVDVNEAMVAVARGIFPGTRFHLADARNLPFGDGSYDVVLAGAILEHIKEWKEALAEICRVADEWLILHRTMITQEGKTRAEREDAFGVPVWRIYVNRRSLEKELKKNGFGIVKDWFLCPGGDRGEHWTFLCRRGWPTSR